MNRADRLTWTVARQVAAMPRGTVFAASYCAIAGVRVAQELLGATAALCGRGGAYDPAGTLALHARHWLFNRRPRAYIGLLEVFDTLSEPHALLATPGQVDGQGNANLSVIGPHARPKVAFGGSRGLPDAGVIHFVMPQHNPRQLIAQVDFVSTSAASRRTPSLLVTELCVMRWSAAHAGWELIALAPGTDVAAVRAKTGFEVHADQEPERLDLPDARALAAMQRIDPLGLRELDFISDREQQLDAMARIYAEEVALVRAATS